MSFRGSASKDSDVMDMIRNNVVVIAEGVNGSPVSDMGVKGTGTWPWWCWIFVGIAGLGLLICVLWCLCASRKNKVAQEEEKTASIDDKNLEQPLIA
jgi:formate-dependent nitrite reductase membrane component NrfD